MGQSLRLATDVDGEINCEDVDVEYQGKYAKDGQVGDVDVDDQGDRAERGGRAQAG